MVRQIVFHDDVTWIVRIPMPRRITANDGGFNIETADEYWTEERAREMQKEVFTMMYIRDHSDICVPEISMLQQTIPSAHPIFSWNVFTATPLRI
jgi:hypothetical protein